MKFRQPWNYANFSVFVASLLGISILLYLMAMRIDRRFDATGDKRFTLSGQSLAVIGRVASPVSVLVFYHAEQRESLDALKDLLGSYRQKNSLIQAQFLELDREPVKAMQYGVKQYGEVVLVRGERTERAAGWTEEEITNALLRLEQEKRTVVYFTEGHGEISLQSADRSGLTELRDQLTKENYDPRSLILTAETPVPDDAAVLVIASPKKDFFDDEIEKLEQYVEKGGALFVLLDPSLSHKTEAFENFLSRYGIQAGTDVVVDPRSHRYGTDAVVPILDRFTDHPITRKLRGQLTLAMTRSVRPGAASAELTNLEVLAATSTESWAETNLETLEEGRAVYDEEDGAIGLVPVAVLAEGRPRQAAPLAGREKRYRLVVVGDSDFLANTLARLGSNLNFALNTLAWLSGRDTLVAVKPKIMASTPLYLSSYDEWRLFLSMVVCLPLLILLSGTLVSIRRNRRADRAVPSDRAPDRRLSERRLA